MEVVCHGIIPFSFQKGSWRVLLIKHARDGFWGFPKGHAHLGESSKDTALRELKEETGLEVTSFIGENPVLETYDYLEKKTVIHKTVFFYLAVTTTDLIIDEKEVIEASWHTFDQAKEKISFKEGKKVLEEALILFDSEKKR